MLATFAIIFGGRGREEQLAAVIRSANPDIVLLQEATDRLVVGRIAELCVARSPFPSARIRTTGGDRGWRGDVPRSRMRPDKLAALGFRVAHTSDEAVALAVEALAREVFPEPRGAA